MANRLLTEAAASVDATPILVPILGDLFTGIDSLGSSPRRVIRMLKSAGLRKGDRLLDLGCGKGAAAIAAAKELGCRCVGVDAVEEFITAARTSAATQAVEHRCEFRLGDIRTAKFRAKFDAAIMLGVCDVVTARRLLRKHLHAGGI